MQTNMTAWAWVARLMSLVAIGTVALWAASAAAGNVAEPSPTATIAPTATLEPTKSDPPGEVEPSPTTENGGGIVVDTPTPTEEKGGIAPGFVTVVVWTGDGGPLPDGTTVCVGSLCQSGAGRSSGAKIVFDRVDAGWQEVTVRGGAPYGEAASSVRVVQGQGSRVELTMALLRPVEVTPTERASGPLRDPIVVSTSQGEQAWETGVGAEGQSVVPVNTLPVTGAGQTQSGTPAAMLILGTILLVAGAAVVARRRAHAA